MGLFLKDCMQIQMNLDFFLKAFTKSNKTIFCGNIEKKY